MSESHTHNRVWEALTGGPDVVITSHVRLDGDGVGSALALWHALQGRGLNTHLAFQPPTPSMFDFLPGIDTNLESVERCPEDSVLAVIDCGNFGRVGEVAESLNGRALMVNIDHHDSNTLFGDVNYVDSSASSCGEMMWRLFGTVAQELTPEIAECLFTAVLSDTGQFSHQDTTAEAFAVCADCVAAGVRPHLLVRKLFLSPSPDQVRLRQLALGTLRLHAEGRVATMRVTLEMFQQTGLGPVDTEGFSEIPISIRGVGASALLKEMPGCDYIKVSLRSRDEVDVCEVADVFGGGGHTHAAGCEMEGSLQDVEQKVVAELMSRLS